MRRIIKDFIWFLKCSKDFTGYGYKRMIFKEKGLTKAICFCKQCKYDREMTKKYGSDNYYAMMDRTL